MIVALRNSNVGSAAIDVEARPTHIVREDNVHQTTSASTACGVFLLWLQPQRGRQRCAPLVECLLLIAKLRVLVQAVARSSLPERTRGHRSIRCGASGSIANSTRLRTRALRQAPRSHCTAKKHRVPAILPASCLCRGCSWLLRRMRFPALAAASRGAGIAVEVSNQSLPWRWHCWPSAAGCHSEDVLGVYHGHATVQMRSRCTRCTRGGPRIREHRTACMP